MLLPRLIPVLLVDDQLNLVKTTSFDHPHYLGDPLNAAYVFSGFEVDELLLLDIDASPQGRSIPFRFVEALARFARVPLCVGGGITKLEQRFGDDGRDAKSNKNSRDKFLAKKN